MWNQSTLYTLTAEREKHREHFLHQQKLLSAKSCIDNKPPRPKLPRNGKKMRSVREWSTKIQKENQLLLSKMLAIDLKPSSFSRRSLPRAASASTLHRSRELSRIAEANRQHKLRLEGQQSYYSTKQWENERAHTEYLLERMSENSGHVSRSRSRLLLTRPNTAGELKKRGHTKSARDPHSFLEAL